MDNKKLVEKLERTAAGAPARVAFLWQGMEQPQSWAEVKADEAMVSASTIKTPLMMALFDAVSRGEFDLRQKITVTDEMILSDSKFFEQGPGEYTLDELVRSMIMVSDNSATNIIISLLGMERANAYFKRIGLVQTRLERVMLDYDAIRAGRNNYTSARDQFKVFALLYHEKVLTPALCRLALSILKDNRDYDLFYRYLPRNITLAHKSGGLQGLAHDSGIFYWKNQDFYLGIFASDAADDIICQRLIGTMAKMIWDEMEENNESAGV